MIVAWPARSVKRSWLKLLTPIERTFPAPTASSIAFHAPL